MGTPLTEQVLEELVEELEGTLHIIAHAGHASNLNFIRERQEYFKGKYGHGIDDNVYRVVDGTETHAEVAYAKFMHVLDDNPTPDRIAEDCEDILNEHILEG